MSLETRHLMLSIKKVILLTLILMEVTEALPHGRKDNTQLSSQSINNDNASSQDTSYLDPASSANHNQMYVRFAKQKPTLPPWVEETEESLALTSNSSRAKRSTSVHVAQSVCDSISEWVELDEAEDMFGNVVQVVKNIQSGNTRIGQYFYETFCANDGHSCNGIDESRYNSKCETKHIFTYAQVKTQANEVGWMYIKIRGSCNCMLYNKQPSRSRSSIWDELLLRR